MPDMLENLTYSVFGLGNSSYEQYNAAAKVVDKSAHALGAVRLLKIHLGDDDCTLEDDFQGWRRGPRVSSLFFTQHPRAFRRSTRGLTEAKHVRCCSFSLVVNGLQNRRV